MLKVLYAASNNFGADIQLSRFIKAIEGKPYIVKIAAYKNSSPPHLNIDWTINCLLNIYNQEIISPSNENFSTYFEQVKYFAPDLIISDLEYFTSYIANILNIPLWQCSSSMISYALNHDDKYNLGLNKNYFHINKMQQGSQKRNIHLIDISNYNFVYSYLGDTINPPKLKDNFTWIRPYHLRGNISIPCQHNIVASTLINNKKLFHMLKQQEDAVVFSNSTYEDYNNIVIKHFLNEEEYACNIKNCQIFLCEGQTNFIADALYNNKYPGIFVNLQNLECVINMLFCEKLNIGTGIYDTEFNLQFLIGKTNTINYNNNIKYLHEKLAEL